MNVSALPKLLTEAQAYERFGEMLDPGELEQVRGHSVGFYSTAKGVFYSEADLLAYLEKRLAAQRRRATLTEEELDSVVYFISVRGRDDTPIKIGRARNVDRRLCNLQVGHWEELTILATIRGGAETEDILKRKFRKQHIRGEWFQRTPALLETMDRLVAEQKEQRRKQQSIDQQIRALIRMARE